jgi:hypothetical protein
MIIIATYADAAEAHEAKDLLESSGIRCKLKGDTETEAMGNVELLVDPKDAALAEEILANIQDSE